MRLGVYINSALKLRDKGSPTHPDPVALSVMCELAGAEVILIGFSPERGLTSERDIRRIQETVNCDLYLVIPSRDDLIDLVARLNPNGVILVDSSWDGIAPPQPIQAAFEAEHVRNIGSLYSTSGIPAMALVDPQLPNLKALARASLNGVVLHTERYCNADSDEEAQSALEELDNAALAANKFGFPICYSGGLCYNNVGSISALPFGDEIFIGRRLINRALMVGINTAVRDIVQIIYRNSSK